MNSSKRSNWSNGRRLRTSGNWINCDGPCARFNVRGKARGNPRRRAHSDRIRGKSPGTTYGTMTRNRRGSIENVAGSLPTNSPSSSKEPGTGPFRVKRSAWNRRTALSGSR